MIGSARHFSWMRHAAGKASTFQATDPPLPRLASVLAEPLCIAHLVEQPLGSLCPVSPRKRGLAQGPELRYNADMADAEALIPRHCEMSHRAGVERRSWPISIAS
jgi:hypothetical protein